MIRAERMGLPTTKSHFCSLPNSRGAQQDGSLSRETHCFPIIAFKLCELSSSAPSVAAPDALQPV